MSKLGLTEICQHIMPDGDICGKTRDNCTEHRQSEQLPLIHDPQALSDPLDALVFLTQAVGGSEVKKFLETL